MPTTSERNPRVDPKPGDVLKSLAGQTRTVIEIHEGPGRKFVGWVNNKKRGAMYVPSWRWWAKDAEVLRHAD